MRPQVGRQSISRPLHAQSRRPRHVRVDAKVTELEQALRNAAPDDLAQSFNDSWHFIDKVVSWCLHKLSAAGDNLWVVVGSQFLAVTLIVVGANLLSRAGYQVCDWVEDRRKATHDVGWITLRAVLQPICRFLPYMSYLVAFQRSLQGICNVHSHLQATASMAYPEWAQSSIIRFLVWSQTLNGYLSNISSTLLLASFTWTMLLVKSKVFESKLDRLAQDAESSLESNDMQRLYLPLNQLLSWVIIALSGVVGLWLFGINLQPLLALGGVGGIVVGFASQQLLLNLMSGVNLFLTRPFVVGDWVEIREGPMKVGSGEVVKVNPLRTSFMTDDGLEITLPNKTLADSVLINHSHLKSQELLSEVTTPREHQLECDFAIVTPEGGQAHSEQQARQVISAILTRLSTVRGINHKSVTGHISGLTNGQFNILVKAAGLSDHSLRYDALRERFYVAVNAGVVAAGAQMA